MTNLSRRRFGNTEIEIGGLGLGTWALGGIWTAAKGSHYLPGTPMGYGVQSDDDSRRVLDMALDRGVRLIDTANLYGAGHAERLLGQATNGKRDKAFLVTRFGHTYDENKKSFTGVDTSPASIRQSLETTLTNLQTDYVDVFQLQVEFHSLQHSNDIFDEVEKLIAEGKVRFTGWSTNYPARLQSISDRESVQSAQFDLNVFQDFPDMLEVCEANDLTAIARLPLGMGFLTGKIGKDTNLPEDDVRASNVVALNMNGQNRFWLRFFDQGKGQSDWVDRLDEVSEVLTEGGKSTLAQSALRWVFARYGKTIAIPGARNTSQLEENLGALEFGPLAQDTMEELERILNREAAPAELYLRPHRPMAHEG